MDDKQIRKTINVICTQAEWNGLRDKIEFFCPEHKRCRATFLFLDDLLHKKIVEEVMAGIDKSNKKNVSLNKPIVKHVIEAIERSNKKKGGQNAD